VQSITKPIPVQLLTSTILDIDTVLTNSSLIQPSIV